MLAGQQCASRGELASTNTGPQALLDRTGDVGKHSIRVGADQAQRTHHDDENDRYHNGILGYVLPLVV
jgi:hypothetical protein